MSKMKYYKQAEYLFVEDNFSIDEISRRLDISRCTLFYWKNKIKRDEKKLKTEQTKNEFNSYLKEFVQSLMKKIMNDIGKISNSRSQNCIH